VLGEQIPCTHPPFRHSAADIAKAILFLASDDDAWITGTFLTVDGGRDAALLDLSDLKEPE
jgi:NAD(P)-dependent dehydrogenase (short-subunit alcohol dehydrogenase family)